MPRSSSKADALCVIKQRDFADPALQMWHYRGIYIRVVHKVHVIPPPRIAETVLDLYRGRGQAALQEVALWIGLYVVGVCTWWQEQTFTNVNT